MAKDFKPVLFDKCPCCKRNVYYNSDYVIINRRCYHTKCAQKVKGKKSMKPIEALNISPLPWFVGDKFPYGEDNVIYCNYTRDDGKKSTRVVAQCNQYFAVHAADALMMCAAPEMYEALAAMLHCAEKEAPYTDMSHMDIAMDMARKALAKAAGER